ncbi:GlpM family protein [Escherichia coli]|nr:GlpM family protein [Escherichia coli]
MTCYGSVKVKDGAGNRAALGALVVLLIGVLAKRKLLYRRADSTFPTFALIAHYIVASERGIEALRATIILVCGRLFPILFTASLWYFTGMMRLPAALLALLRAGE